MYYVAYGSNMNIGQMKFRCPNTVRVGTGKLYGWKLVFNCHADIINTGNKKDYVPVVVWNILDKKDVKSLDMYEGYPNYYVKEDVNVEMISGEKIKCMVYVMADSHKGIYPPFQSYFDGIAEGYMENGISDEPLYDALTYSLNTSNRTENNQYNPKKKTGRKKVNKHRAKD